MHRKSPKVEGQRSALIALFCTLGQPLSGYGVRCLLRKWHIEEYLSVSPATIYRSLARLEKDGLLKAHEEAGGRYPASRVYRITPAGRRRYRELIRKSAEFQRSAYSISPFLGLGSYLPRLERISLATTWRKGVKAHLSELEKRRSDHTPGRTYGKPYAEWLMLEHESYQLKAELRWLDHYISLLRRNQA